jgi:hypothetical protein
VAKGRVKERAREKAKVKAKVRAKVKAKVRAMPEMGTPEMGAMPEMVVTVATVEMVAAMVVEDRL